MHKYYRENFPIRRSDIGPLGRITPQDLCLFFQEAAGNHAESFGLSLQRLQDNNVTWVLSRLIMHIEHPLPVAGDCVTVETWPTQIDRLQFRRDLIMYTKENTPLAKGVSFWLVLNTQTRKLSRIPQFITDACPQFSRHALELDSKHKLPTIPEQNEYTSLCTVRKTDIDRNLHVNNIQLLNFCLEALPLEYTATQLCAFDIAFKAELLHGQSIKSRAHTIAPQSMLHSLICPENGKEIARAQTKWLK